MKHVTPITLVWGGAVSIYYVVSGDIILADVFGIGAIVCLGHVLFDFGRFFRR